MDFANANFEIKQFKNDLDVVKDYLDYSLETTIKKQIPDININDERLYAKEILCNYFKGDMHSFTSKDNIRNNIYTIGNDNLIKLFLKCMIERHAYNVLIKKIEMPQKYSEQCCRYITNRIAKNHYNDIIEWLNNDFDNIEEIIENYVVIFYKRNKEECKDLETLASQNIETDRALDNLKNEVSI